MDGTTVNTRVEPPAEHRHHGFHVLSQGGGPDTVWHWDRKAGRWQGAGKEYLPEVLARQGWAYSGPVVPVVAPPPPAAPIPEGVETMLNSQGKAIPATYVHPRVKLVDQTVRTCLDRAKALRARLKAEKEAAFSDVRATLTLLAEEYGVEREGKRGGVKLESFDGLQRLEISVANTIRLGPELDAAKLLIDDCVTDWSQGANEKLRTLVNDAFEVGAEGSVRVDAILRLRKLNFDDDRWTRAMMAINDALTVASTRSYIRFYERANLDADWQQVALDWSRV